MISSVGLDVASAWAVINHSYGYFCYRGDSFQQKSVLGTNLSELDVRGSIGDAFQGF